MAHDVSNEPRDEHGRWTSAASALGDDLNHPNLSTLKGAVDRGAWNIGVTKVENDWSGGKTTTFSIMPKVIPAGWQSFKERNNVSFYDPKWAHVEKMTDSHSVVVPNDIAQGQFPDEKQEPGMLYRGMSYEEYQNALGTGSFKSRGDYNLGEEEKGLTYFSTDPLQASAYANGFAPWPYIAAPGSPAIVISIKDPGNHIVDPHRTTEIGIRDSLPTSAITAVYVGHPVIADSGMQEVRQARGRAPQTGSGISPHTSVIWEKQAAPGLSRATVNYEGAPPPPPPPTGAKLSGEDVLAKQRAASLSGGPVNVRDFGDQWTPTGVGNSSAHAHPAGPYMDVSKPDQAEKADQVAKIAAEVANKLGFEPTSINISDEHKTFELNGKTLNTAGWATRPPGPSPTVNPDGSKQIIGGGIGTVTMFTPHVGNDPAGIAGVVAHEVAHQMFNAFMSDKETDSIKMKNDPDYHKQDTWVPDPGSTTFPHVTDKDGNPLKRELGFMRPDGLLNEPYASRYPAYQAWTKAMMPGTEAFAKSDGVSDYSKEYWLGARTVIEKEYTQTLDGVTTGTGQKYKTYAVNPETAFSETIAEIGRLKYSKEPIYQRRLGEVDGKPVYFATGKPGLKPEWSALYRVINENWKRRNAK